MKKNFFLAFFAAVAIMLLQSIAMAQTPHWITAWGTTGGTTGCLDAVNGSTMTNTNQKAIVITTDKVYFYDANLTSDQDENDPYIIKPDTNPGAKRWHLVDTFAQIISGNTMLYVTTTGSDTTGDGSPENPWRTLGHAISEIGKYVWDTTSVGVGIYLANGTYTESSSITINHPCSASLSIIGNETAHQTLTSSAAGDNYLKFSTDVTSYFPTGSVLVVYSGDNKGAYTVTSSAYTTETTVNLDEDLRDNTVQSNNCTNVPESYGAILYFSSGSNGIIVEDGGFVQIEGLKLKGDGTVNYSGLVAQDGATIYATDRNVIEDFGVGINISNNSAFVGSPSTHEGQIMIDNFKSAYITIGSMANLWYSYSTGTEASIGISVFVDSTLLAQNATILYHNTGVYVDSGSYADLGSCTVDEVTASGLKAANHSFIKANSASVTGGTDDYDPDATTADFPLYGNWGSFIIGGSETTDVLRLTPAASGPASPLEGDCYVDTDHNIYCYLDSAWVDLTASGSGGGDITKVGDCSSGDCFDGVSGAGQYIKIYDGDSHYFTLDTENLTANRTWYWPDSTGTNGQYLRADGDGTFTWATPSGSGDVTGVGDCTTGDCLDGSSDGGSYIRIYDGDSHYMQIDVENITGNLTWNMPTSVGSAGDFFESDGDGTFSWATPNAGTDITADLEEETHASEHGVAGADSVFPADPNADRYLMWDDDPGQLTWAEGAGGGAPTDASYLTAEAEAGLSNESNLGALSTGLLKITVAAGVATPSTAVSGTDYEAADSTILKEADVDDTPVNGVTNAPVSSNWAYDHAAAADPHTGYMLESNIGTGANNYLQLSGTPGTPDTTKFLRDDLTWVTPSGSGGDITAVGPGYSTGAAFTDGLASTGTTMFVWEGTAVDTNELSIISPTANPTGDIDITLPSSSGTLLLTDGDGSSLTSVDAATGDSATAFFDTGTIETNYGGTGADLSSTTGIMGMNSGSYVDVDTAAELETYAGLGAFANEYLDDADAAAMRTTLGLDSAATRAAEDSLTDGSNLPDGAAIIAYGNANWGGGSFSPTTYYVDADASPGGDGSYSTPWDTVADVNGASLDPGDTVLFQRGDEWGERLNPPDSGAPGLPIVFGAYGDSQEACPIIDGESDEANALYIGAKSHLRFKDIVFERGTGAAVHLSTWNADVSGIEFYNCTFQSAGAGHGVAMFDREADQNYSIHDVLIDGCYVYNNTRNGIGISGYWNTHNITVRNCLVDSNNQDASTRQGLSAITDGFLYEDSSWSNYSGNTYYRTFSHTPKRVFQDETSIRELTEGTYTSLSDGEYDTNGGNLYINIGGDPSNIMIRAFVGATHHVLFLNNEVKKTVDSSGDADGVGIFLDWCVENSAVIGNYIHDNDGYGISVLAGVDNRVVGNVLENNGVDRATATEININKMSLRTQVAGNIIRTGETYGIAMQNAPDYTSIVNNDIIGATYCIGDVNNNSTNDDINGNMLACTNSYENASGGSQEKVYEDDTHASEHAMSAADSVFPADPDGDRILGWDDDPGTLEWMIIGDNLSYNGTTLSATSSVSSDYDDIGDPDANGSIDFTSYTGTYTSATDGWGGLIVSNTTSDNASDTTLLSLTFNDDFDTNSIFLKCINDADSGADNVFKLTALGGYFGASTPTQSMTGDDLFVSGFLEVDGSIYADGGVVGASSTDPYISLNVTDPDDTDWAIGTNADAGASSDDNLEFRTSTTPGSNVVAWLEPDTGDFVLEGSTGDGTNIYRFDLTDPTAARTITLDNNSVNFGHTTEDYVLTYNASTRVWAGEAASGGGGDNVSVDSSPTTDPDFQDGGDINFTNTSNVITATLKDDVVGTAEMANADHGDFTYSGGQATLDTGVVVSNEVGSLPFQKDFTISDPVDADDYLLFKAQIAMTITDIHCIVDPADTGDSISLNIQECDGTGDNCATVDAAITCDNDGAEDDGTFTNGSIDAGDWVKMVLGAPSGTVDALTFSIYYTEDK